MIGQTLSHDRTIERIGAGGMGDLKQRFERGASPVDEALEKEVRLEWLDRGGKRLGTLGERRNYGQVALSPDDRRVAAEIPDGQGQFDIWTVDWPSLLER